MHTQHSTDRLREFKFADEFLLLPETRFVSVNQLNRAIWCTKIPLQLVLSIARYLIFRKLNCYYNYLTSTYHAVSSESLCSTGWVAYGKSCFLIIDIPTLEWNDARRNCQNLAGDLAKITSAAEDQFIYSLIQKQTKIAEWGA